MKIEKPTASFLWSTPDMLKVIELAGRVAYKSEDRITEDSAEKFVRMLIKRGHESVVEHASASMLFVMDRGVSHEFVRHRLFSFTQESSRYCNYASAKFGHEISVIEPPMSKPESRVNWIRAVTVAESEYFAMLENGESPQIARSVLPTSLKTEIVVSGNMREWRYFLRTRTALAAHPQMREVASMARNILVNLAAPLFDDIEVES